MIEIAEIPDNDLTWRVDWFGGILQDPSTYPSEPLLEVFLNPLDLDWEDDLTQNKAVLPDSQECVRIAVGQFPFFTIGSLWKNLKKLREKTGRRKFFRKIPIDPDTVRWIRSDQREDQYLVPDHAYRLGSRNTLQSYYLTVQYNGDDFGIVVPVIEIIRFYYGSSMVLLQEVFNGAISAYLWLRGCPS